MSAASRPPTPGQDHVQTENEHAAPALAPTHEDPVILAVSTSPSPVPPTPPPKDIILSGTTLPQDDTADAITSRAAARMSKIGVKAAPPNMEDPAESIVIDISGPVVDPDETIRVDGEMEGDEELRTAGGGMGEEHVADETNTPRESDVTDADITIVQPSRHSDSPEQGGSTLYGSGLGGEGEREHVHEHPLRFDIDPPSPQSWNKNLEDGDRVLGDDDDDDDGDLGGRRNGRASPQRYVFTSAKAHEIHDFSNKPQSPPRPLIPHSAYYFGPPPANSAYGTDPCGQIGVHHPREVVRIERDFTGGELPQFLPTYPLELEGRITPTQFLETINAINEILLSAHSLGHAFVDNALAFFSLQISRSILKTHYEKEMNRLHSLIDELNVQIYNPVGLHIRWPHSVAFLFLEIEYY